MVKEFLKTLFVAHQEITPPKKIDWKGESIENPRRIELREMPIETYVLFRGEHPDSNYTLNVFEEEKEKKIKIWHNMAGKYAIGPLEAIVSITFRPLKEEPGVLEIGKNYFLPYFISDKEGTLILDVNNSRTEPYTDIKVKRPD